MTRVTFTTRARRDLRDVGDYIATDNPVAAIRFVEALQDRCSLLQTLPLMGRARPDIGSDVRSFPYRSYLVFYRYRESVDHAQVLRIWHGSRRAPKMADLL